MKLGAVEGIPSDAPLKDLMGMATVKKMDRMKVVLAVRDMFRDTKLDRIVRRKRNQDEAS